MIHTTAEPAPARFFYDTEFLENGRTIELISIGIVTDRPDGPELYLINGAMPQHRIREHVWLREHVWPYLPTWSEPGDRLGWLDTTHERVVPHATIASRVREFLRQYGPNPELWADYAAYDHVVLMQLWGPMIGRPEGIPMFTRDIQQYASDLGIHWQHLPQQGVKEHHALADAQHTRARWEFLRALDDERAMSQPCA